MSTATLAMPKNQKPAPHCTYRALKLDEDVLALLRLAVGTLAADGTVTTMQELASDILNENLPQYTNRPAIVRKPPPPKPHGKGAPKKSP
jgi:hypothetical protein